MHGYHVYKDIWTSVRGEELHAVPASVHDIEVRCEAGNVYPLCDVEPCISIAS